MTQDDKIELLLIDTRGIYIPQAFAEEVFYPRDPETGQGWTGVDDEALEILKAGPDHEAYWFTWNEVLDEAVFYEENGETWSIHQDGSLFGLHEDFDEWEERFGH